MSSKEKLLEKFLERPGSLRFVEIEKILFWFGFVKVSVKGSHHKFKREICNINISIPVHNNDCRNFYKEKVRKIIIKNLL